MILRLLFIAVIVVASVLGFKAWSVHKAFSVLYKAPLHNAIGPEDAELTLVEIVDYRCKACRYVHTVVKEFQDKHPDVRIVFRHLIVFNEPSLHAAQFALAAGMQGAFAETHEFLMSRDEPLTDGNIQEKATEMGLDMEKFNKDLKGPEIGYFLLDTSKAAEKLGINATPTFIIGNKIVRLNEENPTVETFEKLVAEAQK